MTQASGPAVPPEISHSDATRDEVTTRSGTRIIGAVVEVHPSAGTVVILDANDVRRTIAWRELGTFSGPSFSDDTTAHSRVPVLGRAPLRIRSPHRQSIEVTWGTSRLRSGDHREGGEVHRARCETPCTLWLPPTRVLVQSEARELARGEAFVEMNAAGTTVQLHAPDRTRSEVSDALLIGGVAAVEVGLLTVLGAFLAQPHGGQTLDTGLIIGGSLGAAGIVSALTGLAVAPASGVASVVHGSRDRTITVQTQRESIAPWQSR